MCGRTVPESNRTIHELRCSGTPPNEEVLVQTTERGHSPISIAIASLDLGPVNGEWECPACTYRNERLRYSCEICLAQAPTDSIPPPARAGAARLVDDAMGQDTRGGSNRADTQEEERLESLAGSMALGAGIGAWLNDSNRERGAIVGAGVGFLGNILLRLARSENESLARPSSTGEYATVDDFMRVGSTLRGALRRGARDGRREYGDRVDVDVSFEQLERFQSDRPDARVFDQLPVHTFQGEQGGREQGGTPDLTPDACCICLETLQRGDRLKTLPCCHHFHAHCVDSWLSHHHTCPICKFSLHDFS